MMHHWIRPLLFCLFICGMAYGQNPGEATVITWREDVKLTWDDFKAEVPYDPGYSAQSWTGLEFSGKCVDGRFFYEVNAVFRQDSSWVIGVRKSKKLLRHEQGHFDIAEIYARKLRKSLQEIPHPCQDVEKTRQEIQRRTIENRRELADTQSRYDHETRNGAKKKKQKRWDKFIRQQLQTLSEFQEDE